MSDRVLWVMAGAFLTLFVANAARAQLQVVFESPDEFVVAEGRTCGTKPHEKEGFFDKLGGRLGFFDDIFDLVPLFEPRIKFERQTWELPEYADSALVFLNGYAVAYQKADHHIRATGARIEDFERIGDVLLWTSGVDLSDKNGNDGVDGCVYVTGVGWNSGAIDAAVNRSYGPAEPSDHKTKASVSWPVEGAVGVPSLAPVPTAYAFSVTHGDRHLLQWAYSLVPPASEEPSPTIEAIAIMKDNDDDSKMRLETGIDVVEGPAVERRYSEFRPLPRGRTCGWWPPFVGCPEAPEVFEHPLEERVVVRGVRADFAVPVLVGFDLGYDQTDEHVKHLQASIDQISFDPVRDQLSYRLTTGVTDKSEHKFVGDAEVMLIGFNRVPGPLPIPELPLDYLGWPGAPWRVPQPL